MRHKSRDVSISTYFQVMEGRDRIGVVNDDIKHLLGPELKKRGFRIRSGHHLQNTQITIPKVTQGFTDVKVESRSNTLQHRSGLLGYGRIKAKLKPRGLSNG
jgi:hypothetical protein